MNEGGGNLPLRGDLPDMTSSSSRYLKLLATYREAAETAVEHLASRLSHVSLRSPLPRPVVLVMNV